MTDGEFRSDYEMELSYRDAEIARLKEKCDKQAMILQHLSPDKHPDVFFICGKVGERDENGLPDKILVCPAYGVDWYQVYEKTERYGK